MLENSQQQHIKEEQEESKEIPDPEIQTKISLNPEISVTTNQKNNSTSPDVHSKTISKSEADHDTGGGIATTFKDSTGAALTVGSSADCDIGGEVGDDIRNSVEVGASVEEKGRVMIETKMTNATPLDLIRDTSDGVSAEDVEAVMTANSVHDSTTANGSLSTENRVEQDVFNVSSSGIGASGTGERCRRFLQLVARPPKLLAAILPWNQAIHALIEEEEEEDSDSERKLKREEDSDADERGGQNKAAMARVAVFREPISVCEETVTERGDMNILD